MGTTNSKTTHAANAKDGGKTGGKKDGDGGILDQITAEIPGAGNSPPTLPSRPRPPLPIPTESTTEVVDKDSTSSPTTVPSTKTVPAASRAGTAESAAQAQDAGPTDGPIVPSSDPAPATPRTDSKSDTSVFTSPEAGSASAVHSKSGAVAAFPGYAVPPGIESSIFIGSPAATSILGPDLDTPARSSSSGHLNRNQTIAIAVAGVLSFLLLLCAALCCRRKLSARRRRMQESLIEVYVDVDVESASSVNAGAESQSPVPRLEPLRRYLSPPRSGAIASPSPSPQSEKPVYTPADPSSSEPSAEQMPVDENSGRLHAIAQAMRHVPSRERMRVLGLARMYMHRRAPSEELQFAAEEEGDEGERLPAYSRT
ncbi:hypothetical protein MKEN_00286300 [Mycena kentingensis (nom. inval.)]|nr:hypothetical protein MKEN_00286300 [Mycena kentingensis (nom. inval.)]